MRDCEPGLCFRSSEEEDSCWSEWFARRDQAQLLSVQEYSAFENTRSANNFTAIGRARSEKPKKQADQDRQVVEEPVSWTGEDIDADGDEGMSGERERTRLGLIAFGQNVRIDCHFDEATLQRIVDFDTAERLTPFVKELCALDMMASRSLPAPSEADSLVHCTSIAG